MEKAEKKTKMSRKMDAFQVVLYVIVTIYCLSMIYVLLFGFVNSLKDATDYEWNNPFGLPSKEFGWHFDNYAKVLNEFKVFTLGGNEVYLMQMFFNSLFYAVLMSLFCMATQIITAYAIAKYDFRGKSVLYGVAVVVMLLPIIGSLASEVQMAEAFNFRNNLIGVCIMKCKYPGLYFLVFYATFKGLSWTYAEAAQIDGAGHFIEYWNDYYTPMVFLPESPTMSYGLFLFQTDNKASTPVQLASCLMACLPILVVFVAFKDKIMSNVTMGGIKG